MPPYELKMPYLLNKISHKLAFVLGPMIFAAALGPHVMWRWLLMSVALGWMIYGFGFLFEATEWHKMTAFEDILDNIEAVTTKDSPLGIERWKSFASGDPEFIAGFFGDIRHGDMKALFLCLPPVVKVRVFEHLSYPLKEFIFPFMSEEERIAVKYTEFNPRTSL